MTEALLNESRENTQKLGNYTEQFVTHFYPSYMTSNDFVVSSANNNLENSYVLLNSFTFFKICECTVYNVANKFEYFAEKMQKLFTTAYAIKQEVCYGIVSSEGKTSLVLGVAPASSDAMIKTIIEGLLPGVKIEAFSDKFVNSQKYGVDNDRYVGCISGIPALRINGEIQHKDLSSLMRSLNGQNYTIMVLCKPVNENTIQEKINEAIQIHDDCFAISKKTLSIQNGTSQSSSYGTTHNEGDSDTNSVSKTRNHPLNVAGALAGAYVGFHVGSIVGAVGGGLVGLIAGKRLSYSKTTSKSTMHNISDGYSQAITNTINKNSSIASDVQNGFALELMKMCETMIERLKIGRNIGMWESVVSYSSDNEMARNIIQGSLYSEIASGLPEVLPPVVFSYKDSVKGNASGEHCQQLMIPKGFFEEEIESPLCSMVTSEELCGICTLPVDNAIGFEVKELKDYTINYYLRPDEFRLGRVCELDRPLDNMPFGLSEYDLNKHTFVCGITGSGKTNTVKRILESTNVPFLVIEPAKKEYRNISIGHVKIYTLGRPEVNCPQINPFYVLPGVSPQQHIDFLKDLFSASFSFYGPMPYILEKCLYNIYEKKGWNLTLGVHPYLAGGQHSSNIFDEAGIRAQYELKAHHYIFPTMQDLKDEVDDYIEHKMTYEGEVRGNIRGAIKARIDSLCVGAKGYMFNTHDMIDFQDLLKSNSVLELEGLADDADKAFALGLLIIYISEYRQIENELDRHDRLKHLLVVEEAHRLLKNVSTEKNEDIGNPKGKAVEHFTNMLAEMRSYGQGVIVAEQIPSKLAPEVIKNSSNKIVHRLVAKDDQEIMASTIGVKSEDAVYLGNSKTGYALCHKEGMVQPVIVKIDKTDSKTVTLDSKLFEQGLDTKLSHINQLIIKNAIPESISVWAVKTLAGLMYLSNPRDIYNGLDYAYEQLGMEIRGNGTSVISSVNNKPCILECIFDEIVSLLSSGIFSGHELPNNNLVDSIYDVMFNPTDVTLSILKHNLRNFYRKEPASMAVEIISMLVATHNEKSYNVSFDVRDFLPLKQSELASDVAKYLKG